jgi:hypothetical protein
MVTTYRGSVFLAWIPAFERVKKSKLQPLVRLRSVIPAKAGIPFVKLEQALIWVPACAGTTLRPDFNRVADFFTLSFAGMTPLATTAAEAASR